LTIDPDAFTRAVRGAVEQTESARVTWPSGRLALTEAEAASACGVGRHVLRDARQAGRVSHVKIGKQVRYRRDDLVAFLDCQAVASREAGR
jgi:excisionase family DNA binding protein